jgi:signal-transduction protein with cAMP-binding, CBS, and nucleotidyltransferase domain
MTCRVEDQVHGTLVSLDEDATVEQAAKRMAAHNASSLVVTRDGNVVGLFTEQDLLRRVVSEGRVPSEVNLGEVSSRNLISISADSNCLRAIAMMQSHRCRRLMVYRGQRFIGVVNLTDLAHAIAQRGRGKDLVVNTMGIVTVAVAVGVIAVLLFQLPEMMRLAGNLSAR